MAVKKFLGKISENDKVLYKGNEIGKILINEPHSFRINKSR